MKNFITPVGMASFANVWEKEEQLNGSMKYTLTLLIKKTKENEPKVKQMSKIVQELMAEKFGKDKTKWNDEWNNPIHDGDKRKVKEGKENYYAGYWYFKAVSDKQPGVVGPDAKPLMNQDDFYSGCQARASINFYVYSKGKTGVGLGLNNVMKVADGDRLDGKRDAESEFADFAEESSEEEFGLD